MLLAGGTACLCIQAFSASVLVHGYASPNAAQLIAETLTATGSYECPAWHRLRGPLAPVPAEGLKMFHLPGEPLYLAAAFRWLPPAWLAYVHLPATVALVVSAAFVALRLGGPSLASVVFVVASLEPFVVLHGPVWDDTFLGAALVWATLAQLFRALERPASAGGRRAISLVLIGACAGWAAITRADAQIILVCTAFAALAIPRLAPLRRTAVAMLAGMAIALGAWGLRNQRAVGEFVLGSSHDGLTVWESVYPSALEALLERGQTERLNEERMDEDFARTATMSELQADRYFRERALSHLRTHPLEVLGTALVKLAVGLAGVRPEEPLRVPRNLVSLASSAVLFALAPAGLIALGRAAPASPRILWLIVGFACLCSYLTAVALGPVGLRYRMNLAPLLWIGAAATGLRLARRPAERS